MSKWQSHPTDSIPEMLLEDFARIMREHFSILNEPVVGKPYAIRLIGSPYNSFVPGCRSIQVTSHHRGISPAFLSPHHIKRVLIKFEVPEQDFIGALSNTRNPPAPTTIDKSESVKPN
jgi:hypothetical protein